MTPTTTIPRHGPHARAVFDEAARTWGRRLTPSGRAAAADFLRRYPVPYRLALAVCRGEAEAAARAFGREEVDAACLRAVANAAARWDPERGSLTTAVGWAIRGELAALFRASARQSTAGHYRPDWCDRGGWVDLPDARAVDPAAVAELAGERAKLAGLLARLDARSREVVERRHGLRGGPREALAAVAAALGVSRERVRQIERAAMAKLRAAARKGATA